MGRWMGRCSNVLQDVKCGIVIRNFTDDTFLLAAVCGSLNTFMVMAFFTGSCIEVSATNTSIGKC